MELIPAVDLRGGRCVRLVQGDYDRETVFSDDPGADRVVLGTTAVRDPGLAAEAARRYGEPIVVSIDARDGLVAVEGWEVATDMRAEELLLRLAGLGGPRFVYT